MERFCAFRREELRFCVSVFWTEVDVEDMAAVPGEVGARVVCAGEVIVDMLVLV